MIIAISGTPGTGKSAVLARLRGSGYCGSSVDDLILQFRGIGKGRSGDAILVDTEELGRLRLEHESDAVPFFVEGHLSHYLKCACAFVLRCHPDVLYSRLRERGWRKDKIIENVRAEVLDVVLIETLENVRNVYEIDVTHIAAPECARIVLDTIREGNEGLRAGRISWSSDIERWF